jgi:hypothetical protein
MKILYLLIILANIFVFLWEYRNGAFTDKSTSQAQAAVYNEKIILLSEQIQQLQPALPKQTQEEQPDQLNSHGNTHELENKNNDPGHPVVQLP